MNDIGNRGEASAPSRRARRPARLLAPLLVVAGGVLVTLSVGARAFSILGSQAGLEAFRRAAEGWEDLDPDRSLWAEGRVAEWRESLAVDLGLPLAVLRIPRLGLEVPVWQGVDELTLNRGLGLIPGTAPLEGPGNVGLAGHRDGFFRVLEGIAAGDVVELETLAGVRRFAVTDTWIVEPQAVRVLDPTPETSLTLVTCYPFYFVGKAPNRFVVRARETGGGPLPDRPASGGNAAAVGRPRDVLW